MSEQLSPQEQHNYAENIKYFAELLKMGGEIDAKGQLVLPEGIVRSIYISDELKPKLPEFQETAEGRLIGKHLSDLGALHAGLASELVWKVNQDFYNGFTE